MIAALGYLTSVMMMALVVLAVCADARARAGGQLRHAKPRRDRAGRVELVDQPPVPLGDLQDVVSLDDDAALHGPAWDVPS